jgi:hypothetical protein
MISNYENIINAICDKFHNSISPFKIISWLENFEKADWQKALIVLNSFEYFTTIEIIREFDIYLQRIIDENSNEGTFYAMPVGKAGKSGLAMIYYLKKTNAFVTNKIKILEKDDFNQVNEGDNLILLDDFSGSGESILGFYEDVKESLQVKIKVFALTVIYLESAKILLVNKGIIIYGNMRYPAFRSRGSVFGYYPRMKAIREFCFKYGDLLYSENEYKNKKSRQHPLGYANSQALVGFEHAVPNNTISIIWADRNRRDNSKNWKPIFPRRTQTYIKEASEFKKTSAYWISLLYKLKLENAFNLDVEKYSKYNLNVLSILLLKRKRKNPIYICQFLGLNIDEYENILQEGLEKNVFDSDGALTQNALNILEQVRKKIRFETDKYIKPELVIEEDMIYLPKVFMGSS